MVDTTEAMESQYITADLVKASPTKQLVVTGEGEYENATFNNETSKRLTIPVEIDGKAKIWRPNKDSVKNFNAEFGKESKNWVGKVARLQVVTVQGKETALAIPIPVAAAPQSPAPAPAPATATSTTNEETVQ